MIDSAGKSLYNIFDFKSRFQKFRAEEELRVNLIILIY